MLEVQIKVANIESWICTELNYRPKIALHWYWILYNLQHRFRDKRSCETQQLEFQVDLLKTLKGRKRTDMLLMDFSKAFDKVGHLRLLEKLKYYEIRGKTNASISSILVNSFLIQRKQTVARWRMLIWGRCNIWGYKRLRARSMFILFYINDLLESLNSTVRLFADDTIVYLAINSETYSISFQEDFEKMAQWEDKVANGIPFREMSNPHHIKK